MDQDREKSASVTEQRAMSEHPKRHPSKVMTAVGKCIKWFFVLLAASVFVIMIWRIRAMESLPKEIQTLTVNQATYDAYISSKNEGKSLTMFTQSKLDPITTNDAAYGYFWVADSVILPDAEQLQVVIRYNNSTLEHLASDFKIGYIPSREEEVLSLRLRVIEDATPENPNDNEDESAWIVHTLTPSAEPRTAQKDVYNYRRYVFDGVSVSENIISVIADFYYIGASDAESPMDSLYVYYELADSSNVKLTKNDVTALEKFGAK